MGWLFAVALGLHRGSERIVVLALLPIALGHAGAVALVIALSLALNTAIDLKIFSIFAGAALLAWAGWHALYGHRHRVRIGMRTSLMGLAVWSFLMATTHGAGLMLIPALLPFYSVHAHAHDVLNSAGQAAAAVVVHTLSMLLATGVIAVSVYRWIGLAILKRGWINFDILWTAMLTLAGLLLIWSAIAST